MDYQKTSNADPKNEHGLSTPELCENLAHSPTIVTVGHESAGADKQKQTQSPLNLLPLCPDKQLSERSPLETHNRNMPAPQPAPLLLPGEHSDIRIDVEELLSNAGPWLETPNRNLGGRRPSDLIGTPDELLLREMLRSVVYSGMA